MAKPSPVLDDFESLRVLGKGSYGKVFLVRHRDSGQDKLYAMKMLRKEHVLNRNQVEHTKTERNVHCLRFSDAKPSSLSIDCEVMINKSYTMSRSLPLLSQIY
eukprot:Skav224121  [mRNA]  locus=scaffold2427:283901:287027:- [translate_table: standard]